MAEINRDLHLNAVCMLRNQAKLAPGSVDLERHPAWVAELWQQVEIEASARREEEAQHG